MKVEELIKDMKKYPEFAEAYKKGGKETFYGYCSI